MVACPGVKLVTGEAIGKGKVAEVEKGITTDVATSIVDNSGAVPGVVELPENEKCVNISFVNGTQQ